MKLNTVIKSRSVSEKSTLAQDNANAYIFNVDLTSTKKDIQLAVEKTFNVKVAKVNTVITRGKVKRRGPKVYKVANAKKAFVWLLQGQKIKQFEDL